MVVTKGVQQRSWRHESRHSEGTVESADTLQTRINDVVSSPRTPRAQAVVAEAGVVRLHGCIHAIEAPWQLPAVTEEAHLTGLVGTSYWVGGQAVAASVESALVRVGTSNSRGCMLTTTGADSVTFVFGFGHRRLYLAISSASMRMVPVMDISACCLVHHESKDIMPFACGCTTDCPAAPLSQDGEMLFPCWHTICRWQPH